MPTGLSWAQGLLLLVEGRCRPVSSLTCTDDT
jgi:hypothetical protein